jgi:hypothetical protein
MDGPARGLVERLSGRSGTTIIVSFSSAVGTARLLSYIKFYLGRPDCRRVSGF